MQIAPDVANFLDGLAKEIQEVFVSNGLRLMIGSVSLHQSETFTFYSDKKDHYFAALAMNARVTKPSGTDNTKIDLSLTAADGSETIEEYFDIVIAPDLQVTFIYHDGSQTFSLHVRSPVEISRETFLNYLRVFTKRKK